MSSKFGLPALLVASILVPATAHGMASAELYTTKSYFYGRFDARIQFAPGDGVVSAFFLWKEGSDAANAYWNELDYEKIAADCHMQINNIYGNPKTQHQQTPSLGAICGGYHDYRFEWTPTYIAWVVDGKEIRRDTGADATAYAQNATAGMSIHFNLWPGNSSFGGNINNTTLPVHQYISWVEYSSYDNGTFNVQWHEDFQSSGTPSGWAVGNWASPFNLSTHNPQNVAFVNGIAVLSLTADNATGNPGTPPSDPGAGGSSGAGGASGVGGSTGAGGATASGGSGAGGTRGSGGVPGSGGTPSSGGAAGSTTGSGGASGGTTTSGGTSGMAGSRGTGGAGAGGAIATGSTPTGGALAAGGAMASGGTTHTGGASAAGGTPGTGGNAISSGAGGAMASGGVTNTSSGTPTGGTSMSSSDTGGTSGTAPNTTQPGCNCSMARPEGRAVVAPLFLLAVLGFARRRTSRRRTRATPL